MLVASCYRNQEKLRPDRPLGPYGDLTLPFYKQITGECTSNLSVAKKRDNPYFSPSLINLSSSERKA